MYCAVVTEPFGPPFADDDPGHDAGQDQVRQQVELAGGERGRGVVARDQVKRGREQVEFVTELVGGGDGHVVDQRGHGHVAEVDDPAHPAGVGRDQRVVGAEVVVHELGALGGQPRGHLGGEPAELLAEQAGAVVVRAARQERPQLRQLRQVPQQRPPHQRVVELAQRPAEPGEGDPQGAAQGGIGAHRPEQLAVEVGQDVHHAPVQRSVRDDGPRRPVGGGHDPRHGQPGGHRLDVPQHPDLDADHPGVGSRVGELHHVALATAAGPEQEVVVGLAGQPGEFAGQAVARPDGFGRLGRSHRRGRREPGLVHGCYTICQ